MKKTKLFLFILSIFILGITIVQAASVTTVLEVGIKSPTASISAASSTAYGIPTNIHWSSTNATSCTISSKVWSKAKAEATSGTVSSGPLYRTSTFSIYCSGTGGTSPTVSVTITIKKPTGTLTASNCIIQANKSSCNSNLSWRTYNPIGTSAVTTPTKITVRSINSGTASYPVNYGSRTFSLYNNGILLDLKTARASCLSPGTSWISGACRAPVTLTINKTGLGSVKGAGTYNYGTRVTVRETPSTGYHFTGWSYSCSGTGSCSVVMTTNRSVRANFAIDAYTVSTSAGTGTTISPTSRSVSYGSKTTFTVTPKTRYSIASVTGCNGKLSGTTYTTGTITKACTVTASAHYMTGTLTSSSNSCVITLGHSTCPVNLTWRTYYPIGVSAITASTNITAKKANSGTGTFYPRSVAVSLLG